MPPSLVHLNGSINLPDAETVFREVVGRIPTGLERIPDGETGDRQNWIFFQMERFAETAGLVPDVVSDAEARYDQLPKLRLADGASPAEVRWPDLGYGTAYRESFRCYRELRDAGVIPEHVRFQVQYPTPLASISSWIVPGDQDALEDSYEQALFADLESLCAEVPATELAVQWDVAIEFGILEGSFPALPTQDFDGIADRLARCVGRVPSDVPAGMHLCYGDMGHQHFVQPTSLQMQVDLLNAVLDRVGRPVDFVSFTTPQDRSDEPFFAPLRELRTDPDTRLFFGLVPYHPENLAPGTTAEQIRLVDAALPGDRIWGVSTECGLGRVPAQDVRSLIDLHRGLVVAT